MAKSASAQIHWERRMRAESRREMYTTSIVVQHSSVPESWTSKRANLSRPFLHSRKVKVVSHKA